FFDDSKENHLFLFFLRSSNKSKKESQRSTEAAATAVMTMAEMLSSVWSERCVSSAQAFDMAGKWWSLATKHSNSMATYLFGTIRTHLPLERKQQQQQQQQTPFRALSTTMQLECAIFRPWLEKHCGVQDMHTWVRTAGPLSASNAAGWTVASRAPAPLTNKSLVLLVWNAQNGRCWLIGPVARWEWRACCMVSDDNESNDRDTF